METTVPHENSLPAGRLPPQLSRRDQFQELPDSYQPPSSPLSMLATPLSKLSADLRRLDDGLNGIRSESPASLVAEPSLGASASIPPATADDLAVRDLVDAWTARAIGSALAVANAERLTTTAAPTPTSAGQLWWVAAAVIGVVLGSLIFVFVVDEVERAAAYCCPSIPWSHILAFSICFVGSGMIFKSHSQVTHAIHLAGIQNHSLHTAIQWFYLIFAVGLFLNCAALLYGFAGAGHIREWIFKQRVGAGWFFQQLLGPVMIRFIRIAIFCVIVVLIAISYAFLLAMLVLMAVQKSCEIAGGSIVTALEGVSAKTAIQTLLSSFNLTTSRGLTTDPFQTFCSAGLDTATASELLFVGSVVLIIGQICMLQALASEGTLVALATQHAAALNERVKK
jgi:hypothetical protein